MGTIVSGDGVTVNIVVIANATGDLTNTATVTSSVEDPNTADNAATEITTVSPAANLTVTKADSPDPVLLGSELTYTLTVTNRGPSDAADVTLTDTLPGSVEFASASAGCAEAAGTVTCALGTLGSGDSVTVSIVVSTTAVSTITNSATVSSSVADPSTGDNTATETTTVSPAADLSVTKADSPDPVLLGDELTYTLTVTNAGPSYDTLVSFTDTLPEGVSLVSSTPSQGSCSGTSTVSCTLGTIASGDIATVSIVVIPNVTGDLTNTATVTSSVADTSTGDNTATETTTVIPAANLSVTKAGSPDPVLLGEELTYTLIATNSGPSDATDVTLTDTLQASVSFVSASAGCTEAAGTVTCALGTLGSGDSSNVSIVVRPTALSTVTNTATVASVVADPSTGDNTVTETTAVNPAADLSVTKSDSPDPVLLGQELTYIITVTNAGPSASTNVTVIDTLPEDVSFVSSAPSQGSCSGTSTVTCTLGTIASGDTATVSIVVTPRSTGDLTNTASVTGSVADPSTGDNTVTETTTVSPAADLSVTKADSLDPVPLGTTVTYTLNVSNRGPSTGVDVILTDTLPGGVSFVSVSAGCGEVGGIVTCNLGTLGSGDSANVSIVVRPTAVNTITNTATVTSGVADPRPEDNTATETTRVSPAADLSVSKADSPDPVQLGDDLTYTITVANRGPSTATGVTLTDTLPAGVTFVSVSAGCTEAQGTVTCTLGTVASGDSSTVSIVVTPTVAGTIANTARVTSSEGDPNTGDNTAAQSTVVSAPPPPTPPPSANLSLSKGDSADPVLAGSNLTYTLTVTNAGPSSATGVTLNDTLPASVSFVSSSANQGTCRGTSTIICDLGTLADGASATATIIVTVGSSGDLTNTASVTSEVADPDEVDNTAEEITSVTPNADLALTKSGSPDPVLVGVNLTYTLAVTNSGPSDATGVVLTDTLPAGVSFVSASQGCAESGGTVTCNLGSLASSASASVTIVVVPGSAGELNNTASVTSDVTDPSAENNTATTTTTADPAADLTITKSGSPDTVLVGNNLTYTLTLTNGGPSDATGVVLTDTLPAAVDFVSASPGCVQSSGSVTCDINSLAAGGNAAVTIVVAPNTAGELTNSASVTSDVTDPIAGNNTATVTNVAELAADLELSKSVSPDPVLLGNNLTYTLTVTNGGPSDATDVVLNDTLPAGVNFVSASDSCSEDNGTVICDIGSLLAGDSATVVFVVTPESAGDLTNSASVTGSVTDPDDANNIATVTSSVNPSADLSVTKADSPDPVLVGNQLTYTVTITNNGPSDAIDVVVTDTPPRQAVLGSATASLGTCLETSEVVICDIGTLANGDSVTLTLTVTPSAEVGGTTITNTVNVASGVSDPDAGNNTASQSTAVATVTEADLSVTMSDAPDPVRVGDQLTYIVAVVNNGPANAVEVTLTDFLPLDVMLESATPSLGTCAEASGVVTCDIGTLIPNNSARVELIVTPLAAAGGTIITNTASVLSRRSDPDPSNNIASRETEVDALADLSVTNTDSLDPMPAGGILTYNLVITNSGPSDTREVIVTDILPLNVSFGLALANRGFCTEESGTVTCNVGAIDNGDSVTVAVTVSPLAAAGTTTITNTASVTSPLTDPDDSNNSASQDTRVIPSVDLKVTIVDPQNGVISGRRVTYRVTVTNDGPSDATGVTLTDPLPAGVTFVSAAPSQGSCIEESGTVLCDLDTVQNGASATINITGNVAVAANLEGSEIISNTVTVLSDDHDPIPTNNAAEATTEVYPDDDGDGIGDQVEDAGPNQGDGDGDGVQDSDQGNVTSLKNAVDEQYVTVKSEAGSGLIGVEAIENPSPEDAPADEEFPAGFFGFAVEGLEPAVATTVDLFFPEGTIILTYWKYGPTSGDLTDHWYEFLFDGTTGAFIDLNKVTLHFVDGLRGDDDLMANGQIVDAGGPVVAPADLLLTKVDSADPILVGESLTYTLVVFNNGPSHASDVVLTDTLTDTLPPNITFESATWSQGECDEEFLVVTCQLGDIANLGEATVTIDVIPLEAAGGPGIINTAAVEANEDDSNITNNSAIEPTVVNRSADLSVSKTSDP